MRRRAGTWVTVALWAVMIVGLGALIVALVVEDRNGFAVPPNAGDHSPRPAPRVWDFAEDFARDRGSRNPSRDRYGNARVWGYMAAKSTRVRNPSSFEPLEGYEEGLQGSPGFDAWIGADGRSAGVSFPILGVKGASPAGFAHPSETRPAIVAWLSPIRGRVSVRGWVWDGDAAGGDGVTWALRKGLDSLATGTLENGGARKAFAVSSVDVNVGDVLYLKIAPRRSSGSDSTVFSLRIGEQRTADALLT